jgi:hypothetical protein
VPHTPPISIFSILSPARYLVRNTDHSVPHYAIFSIPRYLVPLRPKYSPQHPILKHPQSTFLLQYQQPNFTPIQNNGQNYISIMNRLSNINKKIILHLKTITVRQTADPKTHSRAEILGQLLIFQMNLDQVVWNSKDQAVVCCYPRYRLAIAKTEFSQLNSLIPTPNRNMNGGQSSESTRLGIRRISCDFFREKNNIGNCVSCSLKVNK